MKNKNGTDKILSMYWFVILIIVAGAIVAMVTLFYGYPNDVRNIEANVMINQISDCLSNNGKINKNILFSENFSLLENCNLNFDVETELYNKQGNYYLEVNFYNITKENILTISEGNPAFKADCNIENEDYERLSMCVNRSFYSVDEINEIYLINVLSIIRKTEKNVK